MTNEQINIAIAEALGKAVEWHDKVPYWLGMWSSVGEGNESFAEFNPAYDLNAIHEAEKMLNNEQWVAYGKELSRLKVFPMVHATARQRAEAFLKTLGKWEE
jgi:arabinogalactan endo-1,4-beta-galactosidase